MVRQPIRIGFDRVNGYLDGGIDLDALKELPDGTVAPMILDVRQRNEYHAGQIQGALNIGLGELQEHLDGLPREIPVVTVCAAGMPAILARSILNRDGRENVRVLDSGGTQDWIDRGYSVATRDE